LVKDLDTPFYLTGGTTLSRFYFNHRFSDDLDFFVNDLPNYEYEVNKIINCIKSHYNPHNENDWLFAEIYTKTYFSLDNTILKIDFVNDVPDRVGLPVRHSTGVYIDSIENMISNKISALFRFAPKDVADIWVIAKNYNFPWETVFTNSRKKDAGVLPDICSRFIETFPKSKLNEVEWIYDIDPDSFLQDLKTIGRDILEAKPNTLAPLDAPSLTFNLQK
jgi:hypothetical protein